VSYGHGVSAVGGVSERGSFRLAVGGAAVIVRLLRLLAWFAFGVALAFVWLVPSRAETIAATPGALAPTAEYRFNSTWHGSYSAAQAAGLAYYAAAGATGYQVNPTGWSSSPPSESVAWTGWNAGVWWFTVRKSTTEMGNGGSGWSYQIEKRWACSSGTLSWTGSAYTCQGGTGYSCPPGQNWTLSGNQCTRADCNGFTETRDSAGVCRHCIAGHYRSQLQYYSYPDPSPDRNYAILTGNSGPGGDVPATACYDGCTVDLANSTDYRYSGGGGPSGHWTFNGAPKQTGAACSAGGGSDAAPVPEKTPEANCVASGMSYGTVNGTVVCVPHGTTQERKVSETTGPGGGKTTTTETRVCTGGSCNSTTTVTNVGGGSAGGQADGTTTTETKGDQSGALQGDGESECEVNPLSSACLGAPAEREAMASGSGGGGSGIQAVALGGGAFCPADSVVTIAGRTVAIPWTHACQLCGYVRPLVVLFGWLIAGYFVVSGLRS